MHNFLPFLFISLVISVVYSSTVEKDIPGITKSTMFLFVTLVLGVTVGSAILYLICVYK